MVVGQRRIGRRGERDVEVDRQPQGGGRDRDEDQPGSGGERASSDPQDVDRDEGGDEQGEKVVPESQPDEQPAEGQVADPQPVLPDEGAMEDERDEQEMERVDLGHRRGGPDGPHQPEGQAARGGDQRPDPEPGRDEDDGRQGRRDEDRREQVRPEGDRAERGELGEPGQQDVAGVAGRVGHAQDVGHHLHLAPVGERHAGHQRAQVDQEADRPDDAGRQSRRDRVRGRPCLVQPAPPGAPTWR